MELGSGKVAGKALIGCQPMLICPMAGHQMTPQLSDRFSSLGQTSN